MLARQTSRALRLTCLPHAVSVARLRHHRPPQSFGSSRLTTLERIYRMRFEYRCRSGPMCGCTHHATHWRPFPFLQTWIPAAAVLQLRQADDAANPPQHEGLWQGRWQSSSDRSALCVQMLQQQQERLSGAGPDHGTLWRSSAPQSDSSKRRRRRDRARLKQGTRANQSWAAPLSLRR